MENNLTNFVIDDTQYQTLLSKKFQSRKKYVEKNPKLITAYIPGNIQQILVNEGQNVQRGKSLLILEAMKMKNDIKAPVSGKIKKINVKVGQMVPKNHLLLEIE